MTAALTDQAEQATSTAVWSAARRFATGVSVVTTGAGEAVHGSTASSFTLISREPPLITVALDRESRLLTLIRERGSFGVNVLSSRQAGLARHFASRSRGSGRAQFDGVEWAPADGGTPRLSSTVCWLYCLAHQHIPAGDHEIVLAGVSALAEAGGAPLLYFAGGLHPGTIQTEEEHA